MTIFAVEYHYDTTRTQDIETLRPQHRAFLKSLHEAGTLIASGPWLDNAAPGALILIRAADHHAALDALDPDPLHRAHLITHRAARAWQPVIGSLA
ncbi:YciI family protein [Georgenia sp. SYP-B2076]|uniref:YciI family protein n=1 Tax=Georgenia sp. SYP-B2076 TaxID=2495881 RepID=UPI000F8F5742|nr:YciI family protein [Georgenia sp. SYP-B2076]